MRNRGLSLLPVGAGLVVCLFLLLRGHPERRREGPPSVSGKTRTPDTASPDDSSEKKPSDASPSVPAKLSDRPTPPAGNLHARAILKWEKIRPVVDAFLSKHPFALPEMEYRQLLSKLESILKE